MRLKGSCKCGSVTYSVNSRTPYPYMRCYCSICRKTAGSGGYAINLMGEANSLEVRDPGRKMRFFNAVIDGQKSQAERHFCENCGSSMWLWDPRWPELIHPHASSVDTPLPAPPQTVHMMLKDKPAWVQVPEGPEHVHFDGYPELSIEDWHKTQGLYESKD